MPCSGRGTPGGDHCCYVEGQVCRYLEENTVEGRRFVCGLRRRLGSWEKVHKHRGYRRHVQTVWDRVGIASCGDWQPNGTCCEAT